MAERTNVIPVESTLLEGLRASAVTHTSYASRPVLLTTSPSSTKLLASRAFTLKVVRNRAWDEAGNAKSRLATTTKAPTRRTAFTEGRRLRSGDRCSGFSLSLCGPGFPHRVGVVDLGLRLGVILLRVGHHLLGLLHQALGFGRELHGLRLLDGVLGGLDLHGAVPRDRRAGHETERQSADR